jgi:hypothetical protein
LFSFFGKMTTVGGFLTTDKSAGKTGLHGHLGQVS